MNDFTVSLFGHREINELWRQSNQFAAVIKKILRAKPYVTFLIGRNGAFDEYAASVIKCVQREMGKEKSEILLVLPYTVTDIEYYEKYYDDVIIPESVYGAHPKAAITLKNQWMIECSDLVIVYVERNGGGAYTAMKYAQKLKKQVVNLCTGCPH